MTRSLSLSRTRWGLPASTSSSAGSPASTRRGASSYSSNTTQIARIEIKGQGGYIDMSTLKICFRLAETGGEHPLVFSGGPHALVSRIRVFCQGTLVEDCSHYGRVHHLFTELMVPSNWRMNQP